MIHNFKSKRECSPEKPLKRRKLEHSSFDRIGNLLESEKGEAIQALHILYKQDSFTFETSNHAALPGTFVSFLNIEGYTFLGYGSSKIKSRASACKTALLSLIKDLRVNSNVPDCVPIPQSLAKSDELRKDELDIVASLVLSKYKQIRDDLKQNVPWYKMIGGIVMVTENNFELAKVVALSTGSKCIQPKNVKIDGTVIIDSHAEILVRKAFQYFLYKKLRSAQEESSIFEINGTKYSIKPEISFYLFINSAPCGDSRIFAVSDKNVNGDRHPNRLSRGMLRIKLDGGNSTVPIKVEKYKADERLKIMSCSDKLLKMNVLGAQGTLLNDFIQPVYFKSVVIGDLFNKEHLTRALYGRIEDADFQMPFRVNKINIHGMSDVVDVTTKSPKTTINWIAGESVEVLCSATGKTMSGSISRLSKLALMEQYSRLKKIVTFDISISNYQILKGENIEYQSAKNHLYKVLSDRGLGFWIQRCIHVNDRDSLK